jgi:apolipoprotein N-acyltransferase
MALIFAPSLWIISEWLRGHIFTGFPWNLAAYSQYLFLPIVQIGEFFGPYGLSWLIVAFNSAVVYLIVNRKKDAGLRKFIYPTAILVLFMVSLIYGTLCIDSYSKDSNLKVVLIQGDAGMENWTFDDYNKNLQKHSDMIMQSGREGKGLAILSETSLRGFGFHPGSSFAGWMRRVSKYYNSAVLLLPNKEIPQIYSKVHLVPFGEYIPFKKILFFVDKFSKGIIGDFSAGEKYEILTLSDGHRFGTGICYELLFPELMRQFTINGAEFLANITNDTWYGKTVMPYHHFSLSVFRAVENRKYVVRAANSGFSGITAPDGRIIEKSGLYTDTIISSYIHPNRVVTIYAKFGDWFIYLNALTLIVCIASINWKKRRQKEK